MSASATEASVTADSGDRRVLMLALGVLGTSAVAGAAIGGSRLGLVVPTATSGSAADASAILVNNLEVLALFVASTLLQPHGVPKLAPGFLPLWLTDLAVGLVVTINLIAIGGVVGALGIDALLRIVPHAPFEIGGYLLVLVGYLHARRGDLGCREALMRFALAGALLTCGAWVESYVSGGLG